MLPMPVTIVETKLFSRLASGVWKEDELAEFVDFIARNPEAGMVIPETGGVRKIRWSRQGGGKRGGVRVIYFFHNEDHPLYLMMIYAKASRENMNAEEKRAAQQFAADLKRQFNR